MLALWLLGVLVGSGAAPALLRRMSLRAADHGAQGVMALGLAWIGAVSMAQAWPFMALALVVQGVGLGAFQVVYADQVVSTLPDSARGLSGSLTLVTRTVGIVAAAMFWLWMMDWLQSRAYDEGASNPEAIWAGTIGLLHWAAGLALALALLSVWRQFRRVR
jgi:uncharacterized membrane protein YidH (DUF202 family)